MSSPRVRRLESDYERISTRFEGWPLIQVELADGQPPDMYRIWYNVRGLFTAADGRILEREDHVLEIRLGLEYPRRAPQLRLLTPLFHPNFNNTDVCAQDIYAASEGLDDLIVRIGRMIGYQEYNTKSPLNGIAAKWAAENSHRLPVDGREIAPLAPTARSEPSPFASMLPEASITTRQPPSLAPAVPPHPDSWEDQIVIGETEIPESSDDVDAGSVTSPQGNGSCVRFSCRHCGQSLEADSDMIGDILACPSCGGTITVGS